MKPIGEIPQGQSWPESADSLNIAMLPERKIPTPSDGSEMADTNAPTPSRRPSPEELTDILSSLSTIRQKRTPMTQQDAQNALKVLAYTNLKMTKDEGLYHITRLLACFPRRDPAKDGIIVAELLSDMMGQGATVLALATVCRDIRQGATAGNPFMPEYGEILNRVKAMGEYYRAEIRRVMVNNPTRVMEPSEATTPRRTPWARRTAIARWDDVAFIKTLDDKFCEIYCRGIATTPDEIRAWAEGKQP